MHRQTEALHVDLKSIIKKTSHNADYSKHASYGIAKTKRLFQHQCLIELNIKHYTPGALARSGLHLTRDTRQGFIEGVEDGKVFYCKVRLDEELSIDVDNFHVTVARGEGWERIIPTSYELAIDLSFFKKSDFADLSPYLFGADWHSQGTEAGYPVLSTICSFESECPPTGQVLDMVCNFPKPNGGGQVTITEQTTVCGLEVDISWKAPMASILATSNKRRREDIGSRPTTTQQALLATRAAELTQFCANYESFSSAGRGTQSPDSDLEMDIDQTRPGEQVSLAKSPTRCRSSHEQRHCEGSSSPPARPRTNRHGVSASLVRNADNISPVSAREKNRKRRVNTLRAKQINGTTRENIDDRHDTVLLRSKVQLARKLKVNFPPSTPSSLNPQTGLPIVVRKKHRIPRAPEPGMKFFRTILRRPLEEGEMLSDSDMDIDETWLTLQHNETLDDLDNVTLSEKEFMKKFDEHFQAEQLCSNRYVGDALLRFTNANKPWLGQKDMRREFARKAAALRMDDIVTEKVVTECLDIIHGPNFIEFRPTQTTTVQSSAMGLSEWSRGCLCGEPISDMKEIVICANNVRVLGLQLIRY